MDFKKLILLVIYFLYFLGSCAQTNNNQFLFKKKIIQNNENLFIVADKTMQLYFVYTNGDSVKMSELYSCYNERGFHVFPQCWDVDDMNRFSFMSINKGYTTIFITRRTPLKLITENQGKGLPYNLKYRNGSSNVHPLMSLYIAWQREKLKSPRMTRSFLKTHKDLFYNLTVEPSGNYLFYMTKKDTIEEYKFEFKGYWTKTKSLSQNFNSVFQAIRQNDATYLLTDSALYKVKEDTLLRTGRIIKKTKEEEITVSNFFIDDKDSETIYLFPPYYFIKENDEAPKIETLKPKKKLYKSALKLAEFYMKETEE